MNALGYLRLSGKGQEDGDGLTRQKLAIERYAGTQDIVVTAWYQDIQTGKDDWELRPGWSDMVAQLGTCRTILVEKLDRVARAVLVQELIIRDLTRREVSLITANGDDTSDDTPERVMYRQLLGVFAQFERATTVLKLRGARQRMKEQTGRCEGRKPYGFKPGESDVLATMRELRNAGVTYDGIARHLNASGMRARSGGAWIGATITNILARPENNLSGVLTMDIHSTSIGIEV